MERVTALNDVQCGRGEEGRRRRRLAEGRGRKSECCCGGGGASSGSPSLRDRSPALAAVPALHGLRLYVPSGGCGVAVAAAGGGRAES